MKKTAKYHVKYAYCTDEKVGCRGRDEKVT